MFQQSNQTGLCRPSPLQLGIRIWICKEKIKHFSHIKKRRRIYLTINSVQSRKVIFPNIYDLSLRQATRELEKSGLEVGNLQYRADIATNKVLNALNIKPDLRKFSFVENEDIMPYQIILRDLSTPFKKFET